MNISIFASIGCKNLGDELILENEIKAIEEIYKDKEIKFQVFTYDLDSIFFKKDNVEYLEYFPIGIKNKKNINRNIKNLYNFIKTAIWSDLIVIGGGGIIFDNEIDSVTNPLKLWLLRVKIFNILKKKVMFYSIGIDIKHDKNLNIINKIFKKAYKIYVRDGYSKNILDNLNIKSFLINDSVFSDNILNNKPFNKSYLLKECSSEEFNINIFQDINLKNKTIGLAIRKGFIGRNGEEEDINIKQIINYIIDNGGNLILLPHSFHKENLLSNDYLFLKDFLNGKDNIKITRSIEETYKIYKDKKIDLCIAERLHSIILSQVYEISFIAISYSRKTKEQIKKLQQ